MAATTTTSRSRARGGTYSRQLLLLAWHWLARSGAPRDVSTLCSQATESPLAHIVFLLFSPIACLLVFLALHASYTCIHLTATQPSFTCLQPMLAHLDCKDNNSTYRESACVLATPTSICPSVDTPPPERPPTLTAAANDCARQRLRSATATGHQECRGSHTVDRDVSRSPCRQQQRWLRGGNKGPALRQRRLQRWQERHPAQLGGMRHVGDGARC